MKKEDILRQFEAFKEGFLETFEEGKTPEALVAIEDFMDELTPRLRRQLSVANLVLGSEDFSARALLFTRNVESEKFELIRVEPLSPQILSEDAEHLRAVLDGVLEAYPDEPLPCLWISPFPIRDDTTALLILVRDRQGYEAVYASIENRLFRLPLKRELIDHVLGMALGMGKPIRALWKKLLQLQAERLSEKDVLQFVQNEMDEGAFPELTAEHWQALVRELIYTEPYITTLQECVRILTTPALHEAQKLLEKVDDILDGANSFVKERVSQKQKEIERAERKFRKDLELHRMARSGAENRAKKLHAEVVSLKNQLLQAKSNASHQSASDRLGAALDAYFPALEAAH